MHYQCTLQKHLLPATILDFISSLINFFGFIKAPKYLKFRTPSNICSFVIRYCSQFVIFLFSFIYFVLLLFITNLVLTAASLICVTTSLIVLTHVPYQHIICICYILSPSVKDFPFALVSIFLITSSTKLNSVVDCAWPCLKPVSGPST